jgi:crotonobetainyl-CoA:carnitine CoA-transferase CaiB-like acyl-CoA transferase
MGRAAGAGGFVQALDGYVMVAAPIGHMTDRLAKMLNVEEATRDDLIKWAEEKTVDKIVSTLAELEIPVAPVLNVEQSVKHPHYLARNMIVEIDHPKAGKMRVPNFPIKLSESPGEITRPAPILGEHNDEILSTLLRYSEEEIARLREDRVIV